MCLKDEAGTVYFDSPHVIETQVIDEPKEIKADTTQALQMLTDSGRHSIARICCFLDNQAANGNTAVRLRNSRGNMFVDGNNVSWTDPGKTEARMYLYNLARDAAELGFQEILLTAVGYPAVGQLDRIAVGDAPKGENLALFLSGMREALEPYGVTLSIEVPKTLLLEGGEDVSGLSLDVFAPWVDRVYARVEPEEVQRCADALSGILDFVPELAVQPESGRYLVYPF